MKIVDVVVGVVIDDIDQVLVAQRPTDKVCAGMWEFPGGKIEPGESPEQALARELKEELDIIVVSASHLFNHTNYFPDRQVDLRVYKVSDWSGKPVGLEDQAYQWCGIQDIPKLDFLPGNLDMLPRLDNLLRTETL